MSSLLLLCPECGRDMTGEELICAECISQGTRASLEGGSLTIVYPERMPIIYDICPECGHYVGLGTSEDFEHRCPNWLFLRNLFPQDRIQWLAKNKQEKENEVS